MDLEESSNLLLHFTVIFLTQTKVKKVHLHQPSVQICMIHTKSEPGAVKYSLRCNLDNSVLNPFLVHSLLYVKLFSKVWMGTILTKVSCSGMRESRWVSLHLFFMKKINSLPALMSHFSITFSWNADSVSDRWRSIVFLTMVTIGEP